MAHLVDFDVGLAGGGVAAGGDGESVAAVWRDAVGVLGLIISQIHQTRARSTRTQPAPPLAV